MFGPVEWCRTTDCWARSAIDSRRSRSAISCSVSLTKPPTDPLQNPRAPRRHQVVRIDVETQKRNAARPCLNEGVETTLVETRIDKDVCLRQRPVDLINRSLTHVRQDRQSLDGHLQFLLRAPYRRPADHHESDSVTMIQHPNQTNEHIGLLQRLEVSHSEDPYGVVLHNSLGRQQKPATRSEIARSFVIRKKQIVLIGCLTYDDVSILNTTLASFVFDTIEHIPMNCPIVLGYCISFTGNRLDESIHLAPTASGGRSGR